jgi:type VI secretion system protein ImpH
LEAENWPDIAGLNPRSNNLIKDLVKNGPTFNVWYAVWIAENITKRLHPNRKDFLLDQEGIKFRPFEKFEYPPRDIKSILFDDDTITFVLTFMGLYGINSPVPRCYHHQVAIQQRTVGEGEVPLQNFLDIFNNRFYWLYYQSWKKYRFYLFLNSNTNNKIAERINSFTGRGLFSKAKEQIIHDFALLKFSGIFAQRVRNKSGLNILLSYLFPNFNMNIREFVPRWIELSDIYNLGDEENMLGVNSYAGEYTIDYMSRICIEIGPVTFEEYLNFLPGTVQAKRLIELLKLYLNDGLEFDFEFRIKSDTIANISWDDERLKLGSTLWMGRPDLDEIKVYLYYEELFAN